MTRTPYGPDELDRNAPDLDQVADRLERYASDRAGDPPADLAARIHAAIDEEPIPARRRALAGWMAAWRGPARLLAAAAVVVAAVVGAVALGELAEQARRQDNIGTSPDPSVIVTPSASPSASPSPSPSPTGSPSPSPSTTPAETASPSASDDDDEAETPEPDESDNSGPGGGGDNSGPGGGGDDDELETPEPEDSDNSGPGGGG